MRPLAKVFYRALRRAFPGCITQSQAVAFNMFLAFFPMLLVTLGILSFSVGLKSAVYEISTRMEYILPPGGAFLVLQFMNEHGAGSLRWIIVGIGGTLLAGTQAMRLTMEGFSVAYGKSEVLPMRQRNLRAVLLLGTIIVPFLLTVVLTVFGKPLRGWMIDVYGSPALVRAIWFGGYVTSGLLLLWLVLAVVYRVGRGSTQRFRDALPGAAVATLLWWAANGALGYYMRHMPYGLVYGGLAGAIGLMIWMQLTAMIVFLGAAFNAEYAARGRQASPADT